MRHRSKLLKVGVGLGTIIFVIGFAVAVFSPAYLWLRRDWTAGFMGAVISPTYQADEDRDMVEAVAGMKFQLVEFGVTWAQIEPYEGARHWKATDRLMTYAEEQGLGVYLIIDMGTPGWLYGYPDMRVEANDGESHRLETPMWFGGKTRAPSFFHPVYREKAFQLVEDTVQRYGDHPALVRWVLSSHYYYPYCWEDDVLYDYSRYAREEWGKDWNIPMPQSPGDVGWDQFLVWRERWLADRWLKPIAELVDSGSSRPIVFKTFLTSLYGNNYGDLGVISGIDNERIAKISEIDEIGPELYPLHGLRLSSPQQVILEEKWIYEQLYTLRRETGKPVVLLEFGKKGDGSGTDMTSTEIDYFVRSIYKFGLADRIFLYTLTPTDGDFSFYYDGEESAALGHLSNELMPGMWLWELSYSGSRLNSWLGYTFGWTPQKLAWT